MEENLGANALVQLQTIRREKRVHLANGADIDELSKDKNGDFTVYLAQFETCNLEFFLQVCLR